MHGSLLRARGFLITLLGGCRRLGDGVWARDQGRVVFDVMGVWGIIGKIDVPIGGRALVAGVPPRGLAIREVEPFQARGGVSLSPVGLAVEYRPGESCGPHSALPARFSPESQENSLWRLRS
jgi:hypothetical protein